MTVGTRPAPGPEAAPGRRRRSQRQVEASTENRIAIVRSALAVFAHYGYTKTTLQAVAEQVGLTRTGLLHHFHSKEGLFLEVIDEGRQWAEARLDRSPSGRGLDGIRLMRNFVGGPEDVVHVKFVQTLQGEALHEDAPEHVVAYVELRLTQIHDHVAQLLAEAQEDGEIGAVDIAGLATMITGTINGLQAEWLLDDSTDTGAALDSLLALLTSTAPKPNRRKR